MSSGSTPPIAVTEDSILADVLTQLGFTTALGPEPGRRVVLDAAGFELTMGTCFDVWAWLRSRGYVVDAKAVPA